MKNVISIALLASTLALSSVATAQPKGKKAAESSSYRLPAYGMAGCGLGSLVFPGPKNNTMVLQILAGTTNNIFFPQTSAITSGTSNCNELPASEEALRIERETFVAVNINDLSKEASQGDGAHLQSLADILGCGDLQSFTTFAQVTQTSHGEIFSDVVPENVTARIVEKAKANDDLRTCLRSK